MERRLRRGAGPGDGVAAAPAWLRAAVVGLAAIAVACIVLYVPREVRGAPGRVRRPSHPYGNVPPHRTSLLRVQGATMLVATRAQLLATRAQLEHRIAALQSELGARAEHAARRPHPHPRVRGGVFTKTMKELAGAIHALLGAGGPAHATVTSGLHEALRAGPAPAQRTSVQSATSRVNSLVKVLERSESAALSSAQKIERQIERLKSSGSALSAHPRHDRELAQLAAHERRASAVLASLRLQQNLSPGVRDCAAVAGKATRGAVSRRSFTFILCCCCLCLLFMSCIWVPRMSVICETCVFSSVRREFLKKAHYPAHPPKYSPPHLITHPPHHPPPARRYGL